MARADNAEALITALGDKCEAIRACFIEFKTETPADLCREIEAIFDDGRAAIWLSTVHRAKGLEANDVFIIEPQQLPLRYKRQTAEQFQQELNLFYVALTRAKKSLMFVFPDSETLPESNEGLVNLSKKEEKK
jgi:superfamily I DNA/RNA helicase